VLQFDGSNGLFFQIFYLATKLTKRTEVVIKEKFELKIVFGPFPVVFRVVLILLSTSSAPHRTDPLTACFFGNQNNKTN